MSTNRTSPSSIDTPPKDHMTLSHIPSTMTNDECFRLTGALPTDRIVQLLDEADRFREAASAVKALMVKVDAALPDEDFAEQTEWRLSSILVDHELTDSMRKDVEDTLEGVRKMMAIQWERTQAATKAMDAVEGALAEWLE